MRNIKYIVLAAFLLALNCSVKKPVESNKKEFKIAPGEKVLMKGRGPEELFFFNNTKNSITAYIESLGPVWDGNFNYVSEASAGSLYYKTQTIDSSETKGWDHLVTGTSHPIKMGFAVYKIGIVGGKWTRVSWIDDRYTENPPYTNNDIEILFDDESGYQIRPAGGSYKSADGKTFFIWSFLANENEPSVGDFDTYGLAKITGVNISGPDSLPSQQSGNFEAQQTPGASTRDTIYLDYTWWLKTANGSYTEQDNWKNQRTISHSSSQSFTLKTEIWDIIHDETKIDTHIVAVGPITGVSIYGPDSLRPYSIGTFTASVIPTHRENYYDDYDWAVWYFGDRKKEKKDGIRLPPTDEWIELDQWDGYTKITFSSSYYDFKLRVIVTDEAYNYTQSNDCLLYTSPSPRDLSTSRMPSSA